MLLSAIDNVYARFLDQVFSTGVCGCLDYDLTQGDDYRQIYDRLSALRRYIHEFDEDTKRQVIEILCSATINDGDHLQVGVFPER